MIVESSSRYGKPSKRKRNIADGVVALAPGEERSLASTVESLKRIYEHNLQFCRARAVLNFAGIF